MPPTPSSVPDRALEKESISLPKTRAHMGSPPSTPLSPRRTMPPSINFVSNSMPRPKPQGALQEIIFEGLVHSAWNLRRVRAMEAELNAFAPGAPLPDDAAAKLDSLARHHTRIERAFFRSLRELKALQTDAAISLTLPPYFMTIAPPLASRTQNCKTNPIPGNQRSRFGSGRLPLSPRSGRRSPGPRPAPPHPRRGRRAYRACHVGELDYRDEPSQLFRSRAPIVNAPM
jgi:hypothetical protein